MLDAKQVGGFALIGMLEFLNIEDPPKEDWNHGFWNKGMVGLENQTEYNCIDFLVIVAYFLDWGESRKWMSDGHHHNM